MKKTLFLSLSFILMASCLWARPVTRQVALQKALSFCNKMGLSAPKVESPSFQGTKKSIRKSVPADEGDASYYVFNLSDNKGFVIISGDDCCEDVLGYIDSGSFDPDNIPDNMQAFLQGYAEEIDAARAKNLSKTANNGVVEVAHQVVAPLIQTHWNQRDPYNQMCLNNAGEVCVTGCVATAMAQVMYYHKWPKAQTTEIPGYSSYWGDTFDALPPTTFKWGKMKPVYVNSGNDDEAAESAVAELMLYCGHSVEMDYLPYSSGAVSELVVDALVKYFGYTDKIQSINRTMYTPQDWDELIYHELEYGRPIVYSASSFTTNGTVGHAFIIDGYDGHGLYHVNWGWGGLYDGFFRLQALQPEGSGVGGSGSYGGYSYSQDAIVHISSTDVTDISIDEDVPVEGSRVATVSIKADDSSEQYRPNSGFLSWGSFSCSVVGTVRPDAGVDFGLAVYQGDVLLQSTVLQENETEYSGFSMWGTFLSGLGRNLADGNYRIVGVNRKYGTKEWYQNLKSDQIYIDVLISDGMVYYTNVNNNPKYSLIISDVEQRFDKGNGMTQIRAYLKNPDDVCRGDALHLLVDDNWVTAEGVYLPAGGEDYVDFFFDRKIGTVNLVVATDREGEYKLYSNEQFVLSDVATKPTLKVTEFNLRNLDESKKKMYGSLFDASATIQNTSETDYEGILGLTVSVIRTYTEYSNGGYSYSANPVYVTLPVCIKAGEIQTVDLQCPYIAIGDKLDYTLKDGFSRTLSRGSKLIDVVPGVVTWTGKGERAAVAPTTTITVPENAAAVSLEDIDVSKYTIVPNSNSNTLYYLANGAKVPTSIKGKNLVMGYEAGTVKLVESKDYFVPKTFKASSISYTRTSSLACNGTSGWQTIVLPFAVKKVAYGSTALEWNNDKKVMWLKGYSGDRGKEVVFNETKDWVPNSPYIFGLSKTYKGKKVVFSATNTMVMQTPVVKKVTSRYDFVGATGQTTLDQAYVMNTVGDAFVLSKNTTVKSGNAYFTKGNTNETLPNTLPINLSASLKGDVDGDGTVSLADVLAVVDKMLGNNPPVFIEENADMDGDGAYSLVDILEIVDIILK